MPDEANALLHRLIGDDPDAPEEILRTATESTSPPLLVAAALLAGDLELLARAGRFATTTRDRQVVAIAAANLRGDGDLLHVLLRDHLSEHPDNLLAAWIAGRPHVQP